MKKIFFLLYFATLSIHATLQIHFEVTGPEAQNIKVCLANEHESSNYVCGKGSITGNYNEKDLTAYIIHAEWRPDRFIKWMSPFSKGVKILPNDNLVYTPKGLNGQVFITAQSQVIHSIPYDFLTLSDIEIQDSSK